MARYDSTLPLNESQWRLLKALAARAEWARSGDFGAPSNARAAFARAQAQGYVESRPLMEHQMVYVYRLTDAGRQAVQAHFAVQAA